MNYLTRVKEGFKLAFNDSYFGNLFRWNGRVYGGEKNPYEQGEAVETDYDYYAIRKRAMTQFLKNGNVKNLISKYNLWLIGSGLQVQMNPKDRILKQKGVVISERDEWTDYIDELFNLWAKSFHCSLDRKNNLHGLARRVVENGGFIAGDVFTIIRYTEKEGVMIELVDGGYVTTPSGASDNIIDGIELDSANRMIAFHVERSDNTWKRIPVYNKNGQEQGFVIFGAYGKLSSVRGLSPLAQSLDYVKKVDEFAEALIKSAKENANVYATIKHGINSTGQSPIKPSVITNKNTASNNILCDSPEEIRGKVNKISEGAVINMGADQDFQRYNGDGAKTDSAQFHQNMNDLFYSNNDLPPEVARNQFGGSYSSSRMVGKTWEVQFITMRETLLVEQFYNKIFFFWFEIMVAKGEIKAPKFFTLDRLGKEAYTNKTFRGITMPHVDPLKEVNAARAILGDNFKNVPLGDLDTQIDKISNADSTQVLAKAEKEMNNTRVFSVNAEKEDSEEKEKEYTENL